MSGLRPINGIAGMDDVGWLTSELQPDSLPSSARPLRPPILSAIHRIRIRSWTGKKGSLLHPRSNILLSVPFRPPDLLEQQRRVLIGAAFSTQSAPPVPHDTTPPHRIFHTQTLLLLEIINIMTVRASGGGGLYKHLLNDVRSGTERFADICALITQIHTATAVVRVQHQAASGTFDQRWPFISNDTTTTATYAIQLLFSRHRRDQKTARHVLERIVLKATCCPTHV